MTPMFIFTKITCAARRAITPGYCDKEFDRMVDLESMEADPAKRKKIAQDADYKSQQDLARPVIYPLRAATCWQPRG